jgi:hypothetical protein
MDIIGFDAQINAPRVLRNVIKKVSTKLPSPMPKIKMPTNRSMSVLTRPVAMAPRPVAVAPRPVAVAPRPMAIAPRLAPAQVPIKMTTSTRSNVMPTNVQAKNAPMAIVKKSGKAISVKNLRATRNPRVVQRVSPIQRSYMKVDLPYEKPRPRSKFVKIRNTPFSYPVNPDMIQPPIDSGVVDYYGK